MIPYVMSWIAGRLAGTAAPSTCTCGLHKKGELPSYARTTAEKGDLEVELPGWEVEGSIEPAGIASLAGIKIGIPKGTTLTSTGDLTTGKISGNLTIPPFTETLSVLGINATAKGELTATGPVSGTMTLSNSGVLALHATGGDILKINSLTVGGLPILGVECETSSGVNLPVNIEGPVNEFASGSIALSEEFTIPSFKAQPGKLGLGCGLVSLVASGSGNKINITTAPPPPINW
jgi:hypothetical protein